MTTDAAFWNALAEKYAAQPVADPAAFERKIAITKAQMAADSVVLDTGCGTGSLALRLSAAGFVDITTPDVGADPTIAFVVAHKPA